MLWRRLPEEPGWLRYHLFGLDVLRGPLTFIIIVVIWLILFAVFPTSVRSVPSLDVRGEPLNWRQKITLIAFLLSILLWLTGVLPEPIARVVGWPGHGLSSGVVAAIIAVVLFFTGLIDERDLPRVNWGALLLIGGGLSLGAALEVSGLMDVIGGGLLVLTGERSGLLTIALVTVFSLGISVIASNTASTSIFLPIAIGLGTSTGVSPVVLAVAVGIATSLDFMLPVGTPPNAIAYSTGKVKMSDMIKAGEVLDILGALLTITLAYILWPFLI